mgnify:CR=1 FL=1|jgi:methionyl-tRNA formyltransferase
MPKITLFTSNNIRHNYLINFLSKLTKNLYVIQESKTIFPGLNSDNYNNKIIFNYFQKVEWAQKKIFNNSSLEINKTIKLLPLKMGDLKYIKIKEFSEYFKSDLYIVFGSSLIKGEILKFLKNKKAINIHMGISPYYRGADCNFWAQNDGNSNLVGATIHYLSDGIDDGRIISHATSEFHPNPFLHSMSTVKSAFYCLKKIIKKSRKISFSQDLDKTIKLSKQKDFNSRCVKKFFAKKYNKQRKNCDLVNHFILKRKNYYLNV